MRTILRICLLLSVLLACQGLDFELRFGTIYPGVCLSEAACRGDGIDVLMISTSLLKKDFLWVETLNEYKNVLEETENLCAEYIEVDSDKCFATYGIKVNDPGSWHEIQYVTDWIVQATHAQYIMLLGGVSVVPRPSVLVAPTGEIPATVPSDNWYIDFDGDQVVDEGFSIGRLPDIGYQSSEVIAYLQTATTLHKLGGYSLDAEVWFSPYEFSTPPYGVCDACMREALFYDLMSAANYIFFTGHGSPTGFYSNSGDPIFTIDYMDSIDFQKYHPVVIGYYSCNTGVLKRETPTLPYAFLKAGAAAFLSRTTEHGVPSHVAGAFPASIEEGVRIGPALFEAIRDTVLIQGETFKVSAGHLSLYGDPTLRRRECVDFGEDADDDGMSDCEDICPMDPNNDSDGDGFCADQDNCPNKPNPMQEDSNNNGTGDACELVQPPQASIIRAYVSPNSSENYEFYVGDTVSYTIEYEIKGGLEDTEYKVVGVARTNYGESCSKKKSRGRARNFAGRGEHVITFQKRVPGCAVPLDFLGEQWTDVEWRIWLKTTDGTVLDRVILPQGNVYTIGRR